eukprot:1629238-Prymnesium_polylepis.1
MCQKRCSACSSLGLHFAQTMPYLRTTGYLGVGVGVSYWAYGHFTCKTHSLNNWAITIIG